jgi:hypothetical protein
VIRYPGGPRRQTPRYRWECRCSSPPILLARYDPGGQIEIKVRDRFYYMASGCVQAICPKCGTTHILDLRPAGQETGGATFGTDPTTGWD